MYSTAVGYAGGTTDHPTYDETCRGGNGHAEVVQVVYDPEIISTGEILAEFWSGHQPVVDGGEVSDPDDPFASRDGRRDQYRSLILTTTDEQLNAALALRKDLDNGLSPGRRIATQVAPLDEFHYAEDYHQQYMAKRSPRFACSAGE